MIIQILLIIVSVLLVLIGLSHRSTSSGQAWKKILLILLSILMIVSVIFPKILTEVAHFLGVGRGADLLLYVFVVVFIFYVLNNYLKQQDQRKDLYRLARRVAISEAGFNLKSKKKN